MDGAHCSYTMEMNAVGYECIRDQLKEMWYLTWNVLLKKLIHKCLHASYISEDSNASEIVIWSSDTDAFASFSNVLQQIHQNVIIHSEASNTYVLEVYKDVWFMWGAYSGHL